MNKKLYLLPALLLCLFFPKHSMAQFYSVRTNLVGMATGNLNVEGSMAFSTRWTAHLPVQYNPFNLWSDAKLKNFTAEPELVLDEGILRRRILLRDPRGIFNIQRRRDIRASLPLRRHRMGGGISAGWVRPLSRRWNIEFELGAGIVWADWERFRCVHCGKRVAKDNGVRLVPTRTAVNLVYLF